MPKPIVCLSDSLRQFLEIFRPCFSRRQWPYFVTVLLALVECKERSTLTGFLRCVAEATSLCGLSRFLSRWCWSADEIVAVWLRRFRQAMGPTVQAEHSRQRALRPKRPGRPKATLVTGYLILDDSVCCKAKGRKMGGLGRHYSGVEKKVVPGHCLFTGLYVLLGRRCPLRPRLYRQKAVCEREGVPFQSKVAMAIEEIEQFQPVAGSHTHLLLDSWYHCKRVRKAAQKRGWDVSGGLKSNRHMRLKEEGNQRWLSLAEYAATLKEEAYQEATWPSQQGGHPVYVHAVPTWVRKLGPTLLLITRLSLDEPLEQARYWGSTLIKAEAQTAIEVLAIRWNVEVLFEDYKDLLGADHYQVMSAAAILRFWTLVSCLAYFLDEQRASLQAEQPRTHVTMGDVRRSLQADHQRNLLIWLQDQFCSGATVDQLCTRLKVDLSAKVQG
jgi:hypothetical protein